MIKLLNVSNVYWQAIQSDIPTTSYEHCDSELLTEHRLYFPASFSASDFIFSLAVIRNSTLRF